MSKRFLSACACLALAVGCSKAPTGKWVSERGHVVIQFRPDNTAVITMPAMGGHDAYDLPPRTCEVHRDRVVLVPTQADGSVATLIRNSDGTMTCEMLGGKFTQQ